MLLIVIVDGDLGCEMRWQPVQRLCGMPLSIKHTAVLPPIHC